MINSQMMVYKMKARALNHSVGEVSYLLQYLL